MKFEKNHNLNDGAMARIGSSVGLSVTKRLQAQMRRNDPEDEVSQYFYEIVALVGKLEESSMLVPENRKGNLAIELADKLSAALFEYDAATGKYEL